MTAPRNRNNRSKLLKSKMATTAKPPRHPKKSTFEAVAQTSFSEVLSDDESKVKSGSRQTVHIFGQTPNYYLKSQDSNDSQKSVDTMLAPNQMYDADLNNE